LTATGQTPSPQFLARENAECAKIIINCAGDEDEATLGGDRAAEGRYAEWEWKTQGGSVARGAERTAPDNLVGGKIDGGKLTPWRGIDFRSAPAAPKWLWSEPESSRWEQTLYSRGSRRSWCRSKPCLADQEQHGLAAARGVVERALPALTGNDAAFGVKVEEQIVPALADEPIAPQRRRQFCSELPKRVTIGPLS